MSKIHFWSDQPDPQDPGTPVPEDDSPRRDAEKHAANRKGDVSRQITSLLDLYSALSELLRTRTGFSEADFHTHGSSGCIALGTSSLDHGSLKQFAGKGFDRILAPGAEIAFHGCNVAEGAYGELFLTDVGSTFLASGGGTVTGSTAKGFALPILTGEVFHVPFTTITARVTPGGAVSLENPQHLSPALIGRRIEVMERRLLQLGSGSSLPSDVQAAIKKAEKSLNNAKYWKPTSFTNMWMACSALDRAEEAMRGVPFVMARPSGM